MSLRSIAKVGDVVSGTCNTHGATTGTVTTGSATVFCDGQSVAYEGCSATLSCGHTATLRTDTNGFFISSYLQCPEGRVGVDNSCFSIFYGIGRANLPVTAPSTSRAESSATAAPPPSPPDDGGGGGEGG